MANLHGFLVPGQTQAEKDGYLIDCFHDAGFLKEIIENDYGILAGRKGTGKTALAKFIEQKYETYDLLASARISITAFSEERVRTGANNTKEKILVFILLQVAKHLFDKNFFVDNSSRYWEAVFRQENISSISTYEGFHTTKKKANVSGGFSFFKGKMEEEREGTVIEVTSEGIYGAIIESLPEIGKQTSYLYFIDDLSDYLDDSDKDNLLADIEIIKEVLLKFDNYNTHCKDHQRGLRFVTCIRDDLFDHMKGSNINKLKTNTLFLSWNEESFAGLIIRRLPHFAENREEAIKNPISSVKKVFPDSLFESRLTVFDTNRYGTKFYGYVVGISFNRPRDFLALCYAMRDRLSLKDPIAIENIEAAEIEYSDYFRNEIRDELYLASQIFDFDSDSEFINRMIDVLADRDNFNSNQLRTNIAPILDEKTSARTTGRKKIEQFIHQLWLYGIIGYKEKKEQLIIFRYLNSKLELLPEKINAYIYYLHRGLWWFAKKRKPKKEKTTI